MRICGTGFALTLIGFVLPWFSIGCGGMGKIYTGLGLVQEGGICLLLILPIIAALIGLLDILKVFRSGSSVVWQQAAGIAPLFFITAFLAVMGDFASQFHTTLGRVLQSLIRSMIEDPQETYGLWITLVGYITLFFGMLSTVEREW